MITPNVSQAVRDTLYPAFCTRILEVEPISFPCSSIEYKQVSTREKLWSANGELTKLHIFRFENYDTLLYIDADCLVVKDLTPLLDLGKVYQESEALIAAAPDIFPPDKFNAGVLVVRPSKSVYDNMMEQRSLLTTYDGGDTGFLNAYFSNWYTDMPPFARLKFGFNAQRFLYQSTYERQPDYWDLSVAPDLHIIHYSSLPKPWESKPIMSETVERQGSRSEENIPKRKRAPKSAELEALWWKWYDKSQNYAKLAREKAEQRARAPSSASAKKPRATDASTNPKEMHKLVSARYKQLRREGKNSKEAMMAARHEYGLDKEAVDANKAVAAMFGLSGAIR